MPNAAQRSTSFAALFCIFILTSSFHSKAAPAAGVSGALSIIPGLGQVANGDTLEGLGWFGVTVGALAVRPYLGFDIWMYNLYDAFRDAKPKSGKYKDHTWYQNYLAVYNPLNFFDPIGGPLLVLYGAWPGLYYYKGKNLYPLKAVSTSFIGWGEESLFRGFLFPAFSDVFNSEWIGAITSSLLFGIVHTQYGAGGMAIVSLFGMIECWQIHNNKYDLRKNIFAHSWVDFFLLPRGVGPLEKPPTKENLANGGVKWAQSILSNGVGIRMNFAF